MPKRMNLLKKYGKKDVTATFTKGFELSKSSEEDIYSVEGIATVTGVYDKHDEVFEDGAFDNQIGKTVPLQVMHAGILTTVGTAKLSKEGNKVLIKGRLFEGIEAAEIIARSKADGVQYNLSIGGKRLKYSWIEKQDSSGIYLSTSEASIREVSFTGEDQQAHPDAIVTKSFEEEEEDKIINKEGDLDMPKEELQAFIKAAGEEAAKAMLGGFEDRFAKSEAALELMNKTLVELTSGDAQEEVTKTEDSAVAELKKTIESLQKAQDELMQKAEAPLAPTESFNKAYDSMAATFNKALRAETPSEMADIMKAISTDDASAGKLIPQLLANEIIKEVKEASPFFSDAKVYSGKRNEIDIPVRADWTNSTESVAEGSGVAAKGSLTYTLLTLKAGKIQSEIELTDEMREDSDFDMVAEIREANIEDFAETLSGRIISGTYGDNNNFFEGFTTNATVIANAVSTETAAVIAWEDLIKLEMALKPADRVKAKYYVSRTGLTAMKTMKDSNGRPLWQTALVPGAPSTFNGYPVVECPDMPTAEGGNYPILFANFSKFYGVYLRKGMESELDRDKSAGVNNHITRMRVGGKVRKASAGALLLVTA